MYRLQRADFLKRRFLGLWVLLAFQAGFVNSFGFLACQRYVSHVTGFGTQVGLAIGEGRWWFALEMLGAPLAFMSGAFVSGALTVARLDHGKKPSYELVCAFMPILLSLCTLGGIIGWFGDFHSKVIHPHDFVLLFGLSFVCGMQNGCFSTMTRGTIRTTHLTGLSTDLGIDLSRYLFGKWPAEECDLAWATNKSRIATFLAFATGAVVSAVFDDSVGFRALWVPTLTSIGVLYAVVSLQRRFNLERLKELRNSAKANSR